jgi:putative ABC transport system substrate-binding protein
MAAQHRLPAVYPYRFLVTNGGLISYGVDLPSIQTSGVLKGARPGDLPVQLPTAFQLVINLKTAKTLGVALSATLVARADEVIG